MQFINRSHIRWKTVMVLLVINMLIGTFMYWNIVVVQESIIKKAETSYINEQINAIETCVEELKIESQSLNTSIAYDSAILESFIKSDRSEMNKLIMPVYSQWQNRYRVNQIQFISPSGIGIWDSSKPLGSGEDLSYRRIISQSIMQKKSIAAIESAGEDCSIVSTLPLFWGNRFVGICDLSITLDKALGNRIQKIGTGNYAIFKLDGFKSNLLWQKKPLHQVLNTDDIEKAQKGEAFYRPTDDPNTILAVVPLKDIDGIPLAYVQGEISRQLFTNAHRNNYILLIMMIALMLSTSILIASRTGIQSTQNKNEIIVRRKGKINQLGIDTKSN